MPNQCPEHYPPKEKMPRVVIWATFFGDFSQSEKISEIKPPEVKIWKMQCCEPSRETADAELE